MTFEQTIKAYLDKRAKEDALFAETYKKEGKSIKECCKYIMQEASKRFFKSTAKPIRSTFLKKCVIRFPKP